MALTRSNMQLLASGGAGKLWSYSTTEAIATVQAAPTVLGTEPLAELEPLLAGPAAWPGAKFPAEPVRPGAQHPWDTAADGNAPNGNGANRNGSDAGGGHDDL